MWHPARAKCGPSRGSLCSVGTKIPKAFPLRPGYLYTTSKARGSKACGGSNYRYLKGPRRCGSMRSRVLSLPATCRKLCRHYTGGYIHPDEVLKPALRDMIRLRLAFPTVCVHSARVAREDALEFPHVAILRCATSTP